MNQELSLRDEGGGGNELGDRKDRLRGLVGGSGGGGGGDRTAMDEEQMKV